MHARMLLARCLLRGVWLSLDFLQRLRFSILPANSFEQTSQQHKSLNSRDPASTAQAGVSFSLRDVGFGSDDVLPIGVAFSGFAATAKSAVSANLQSNLCALLLCSDRSELRASARYPC